MKLKSFQNCIVFLIICALFLVTLTIVCIWLGSTFIALGYLLLALLPVRLTVDTYLDFRNYVCSLEWRYVHRMLREDGIWRPLANHLLKVAGIPTEIPARALFALYPERESMEFTTSYSPLDYPVSVSWEKAEGTIKEGWRWRRTDKRISAVQIWNIWESDKWESMTIRL